MKLLEKYPEGFEGNFISYTNAEGKKVYTVPFETENIHYLVRVIPKNLGKADDDEPETDIEDTSEDTDQDINEIEDSNDDDE